jgi:hypothetical protein
MTPTWTRRPAGSDSWIDPPVTPFSTEEELLETVRDQSHPQWWDM